MLISDQYRALNTDLHGRAAFGQRGSRHAAVVLDLLDEFGDGEVLDYGCGRGTLSESLPCVRVQNYDPAIPKWANDPDPAHIVVCTDVLEHVEPDCLADVLRHIHSLTLTVAYLVIATRPDGNKRLADGRDPHLIVQPPEWWRDQLAKTMPARLIAVSSRDCAFRVFP